MVSAYFAADGGRHGPVVGSITRLGGLAVAIGVGFAVASTPSPAWADPSTETDTSADTPSDTATTVSDTGGSHVNDSDGDGADETAQSGTAPESGATGSSETELNVGGDGPDVTIRFSGGSVADGSAEPDEHSADDPVSTADTDPGTTDAAPVSDPVVDPAAPSTQAEPQPAAVSLGAHRADVSAEKALYPATRALDNAFDLVVIDTPIVSEASGTQVGSSIPTMSTRARSADAPVAAAPPTPDGDPSAAPDGLLDAASSLVSGVLNALFVPTNDGLPVDSPIVWAVLGLVRRQFNGPSGGPNPGANPLQTSRTFGDTRTFTLLTDRYAYVLDGDSKAITVLDVDTREVVDFPVDLRQLVSTPVVSPDGSKVFITRAHNGGVYAIDAVFGETVLIDEATAQSDPIIAGGYVGPNDYFVPDGGLGFSADGALLYVSRQHAHIISGLFMPADGDVVVVGNDPSDPATYLQVIGGPVAAGV